jgi:deoxyhypusine synthase
MLHDLDIHRLGNILVPVENYGPLVEKMTRNILEEIKGESISGHQLLWLVGERIKDENSILRSAFLRKVPVIVPGYYDGSFGTNAYIYSRLNNVTIDLSLDEKALDDRIFASSKEKALGLIVGGGISKHHTIWWSQFRGGLDYTVYLTTAVEYDGSLSGAHSREAISWGKIKPKSKHVVVYGDATITLPLVVSSLYWKKKPSPSL